MTTDLKIDPRLDDVLRRTFEAVADQTVLTRTALSPVVRLDSVVDRHRPRWRRPLVVTVAGGAAAAAMAVAVVAGSADGGPAAHTTTVAGDPPVATAEVPSDAEPGGIDRSDRVALWQEVVADALATAGIQGRQSGEHGIWTAIPPMDPHLTSYLAQAGDEGKAPNALIDFEVFAVGEYQADPAWAQQRAGAPVPGTAVPEGLLFLLPDDDGVTRTAVVVGESGLTLLRIDSGPVPTVDRLTAAVRRVAAAGPELAEG